MHAGVNDATLLDHVQRGRRMSATGRQAPYASLDAAFEGHSIPLENRELIRKIVSALPVDGFYSRAGYIKATRTDSQRALHIAPGYTNGFLSEEEVVATVGDVERWRSKRKGLWGISHPENRIREGSDRRSSVRHAAASCPECGLELPRTGICAMCA